LVLKPGENGLRGTVFGTFRRLASHDLKSWVCGEPGSVIIILTQGDGKQSLLHQCEQIVLHLMRITGIMEAPCSFLGEEIALINLPEHETAGIRGKASAGQIGDHLVGKQTAQTELIMADCTCAPLS
jgi:hypothetical protein